VKPLFPWKSNMYRIFGVCVYSLRYPVRNAHEPYCCLWPVRFYSTFPHYLINGTNFEKKKKVIGHKISVLFPLQILMETFVIIRSNERDIIKNIWRFSSKLPAILVRF
jgi:hypothetical protein